MNAPLRHVSFAPQPIPLPKPKQRILPFLDVAPEMCALMSPLEWLMQEAFKYVLPELTGYHTFYMPRGEVSTFDDFPPLHWPGVIVAHQVSVGNYVADFGILARFKGRVLLRAAVECDGHSYHERTPQQARHDRSRDRDFTARGISTLRYTGAEITADAVECARQALNICIGLALP